MAETTLLYLLKQVERAVRTRLEHVVAREGLTVPQYTAMTVLELSPGLTAADLARNSFVRPQSMAEVIRDLERRELLVRVPDPRNRRRNLASLTDRGIALLDVLRPAVDVIEAEMTGRLSGDDVETFRRLLRSSRAMLGGTYPH